LKHTASSSACRPNLEIVADDRQNSAKSLRKLDRFSRSHVLRKGPEVHLEPTMITSFFHNNPATAKSYFLDGLAREDFAANHYGDELTGQWRGQGATRLGLRGDVVQADFFALCDNVCPRSGERLTPRDAVNRRVALDLVFSVPKGVSLLYAYADGPAVLECVRLAVAETMQAIEADARTRVRVDGADEDRVTGNLAWCEFVHTTARPVDGFSAPQLHAHCLVFNATWDDVEGRWKAGQFGDIKSCMPYYESFFHGQLSGRLERLGYATVQREGSFEVEGIADATIRRFSPRTKEIEEYIQANELSDPVDKALAGALTRKTKASATKGRSVREDWDQAATEEEKSVLRSLKDRFTAHRHAKSLTEALDYALEKNFERSGVVRERHVRDDVQRIALRTFTTAEYDQEFEQRGIVRAQSNGPVLVSPQALAIERHVVGYAKDGRGQYEPLSPHAMMVEGNGLSARERAGVVRALQSQDAVTLVETRTTAASEEMLKSFVSSIGYTTPRGLLNTAVTRPPVVVLSPTAAHARGSLREHGIDDARTVYSFVEDWKQKINAVTSGVVWVDEANKLGMKDLKTLTDVCGAAGARLFLAGDPTVNSGWDRSNPMRLLRDHAGLEGVQVHANTRQEELLREVTNSFARGRWENGFRGLDQLDAIRETSDDSLHKQAAAEYLRRSRAGESVSLLGGNRNEVKALNDQARALLKEEGKLKKHKEFEQLVPKDGSLADRKRSDFYERGQVVQFGKHARGFPAGSRWDVFGHDPFGNVVVTIDGSIRSLPLDKADRFQVYERKEIDIAVGDELRITRNTRAYTAFETVKNQFVKQPEFPKHELHTNSPYTVKRFTRDGRIQLNNNCVLDKNFGHIDYGYARTATAVTRKPSDHVVLCMSGFRSPDTAARDLVAGLSGARSSAIVFTDSYEKLMTTVQRAPTSYNAMDYVAPDKYKDEWKDEHLRRERLRDDFHPRDRGRDRDDDHDREINRG
jgi:conjugative relaxase-like TrwC/TraI family protein